jgi:DNA-binding NarL/FixJ family response regulator
MELLSGGKVMKTYKVALGTVPVGPKHVEGDHKTPEGSYVIDARVTPREVEVLTFLSKGFTIKEIANLMGIKWFTVNDHIKSIYKKLNVSSRAEAAVLASKQGLV